MTACACECAREDGHGIDGSAGDVINRHDCSLYSPLSLATELLTADVPVAAMAPGETWARPEKSAAGFHWLFPGVDFSGFFVAFAQPILRAVQFLVLVLLSVAEPRLGR